jgi:hypothetical protein
LDVAPREAKARAPQPRREKIHLLVLEYGTVYIYLE